MLTNNEPLTFMAAAPDMGQWVGPYRDGSDKARAPGRAVGSNPTLSPFVRNGCLRFTNRVYERIIERRTHTSRCDDANENNSGSSRRDRPNGFCRSTLPSTTPSTSNAIFYPDVYSRRFEPRRSLSGTKVGLPPDPYPDRILPTAAVNVSMPYILAPIA